MFWRKCVAEPETTAFSAAEPETKALSAVTDSRYNVGECSITPGNGIPVDDKFDDLDRKLATLVAELESLREVLAEEAKQLSGTLARHNAYLVQLAALHGKALSMSDPVPAQAEQPSRPVLVDLKSKK